MRLSGIQEIPKRTRILKALRLMSTVIVICHHVSADAAGLQSFLIPADRPEKVGNRHRLESHATIHVDSFAVADGKTYLETSEMGSVDLMGTVTVVAVASNWIKYLPISSPLSSP